MNPVVDVIVPVHSASRPVERAVGSVTGSTRADVRITVVCHGIDPAPIEERVRHASVRVISHVDGVASAAGPVNSGLALADARYVSRLDSDDWFEPGAIDAWLAAAEKHNSDVVIAPLRWGSAAPLHSPLTRPLKHTRLNAVKDRLAYRTAPFGLIRRDTLDLLGARYTPELKVGEDLEIGLQLWFLSHRVDVAVHSPCYVVGADATDRNTEVRLSVADELEATSRILERDWTSALSRADRHAIAVKLTRIHVLGALVKRPAPGDWSPDDLRALHAVLARLTRFDPGVFAPFSRADRALLECARSDVDVHTLVAAIHAQKSASRQDALLTRGWALNLERESTLRRYLRYRLPR